MRCVQNERDKMTIFDTALLVTAGLVLSTTLLRVVWHIRQTRRVSEKTSP